MDLSQLPKLGKVGGVPGIAIGALVMILGAMLGLTDVIPLGWRGPLFLVAALGTLGVAVLALVGWMRARDQIAATEGDRSEARNEDASKEGGRQEATTQGKDSPAVNIRR